MLESGHDEQTLRLIPPPPLHIEPKVIRDQVEAISNLPSVELTTSIISAILSYTDLTTLQPTDNAERVAWLCNTILKIEGSPTELAPLAGLCIPGDTVHVAAELLRNSPTRVATVVNFPLGQSPLPSVLTETRVRLEQGAQEIDLVFPLGRYLSGEDPENLMNFILQMKYLCLEYDAYLKTIIQSDELEHADDPYHPKALNVIADVAAISYAGCSDMVKTSTGKGKGGASLQAAAVMLEVAKAFAEETSYLSLLGHHPGVKYSGKISTPEIAYQYIQLQSDILSSIDLSPRTIRFGASKLVTEIIQLLTDPEHPLSQVLHQTGIDRNAFTTHTRY